MHKINQLLQDNQNHWIKQTVQVFDPNAEVFLFGPGTQDTGMPIDVYIKSEEIDADTRDLIKKQLLSLQLHVDLICELKEAKILTNMRTIGIAI